MTSQNTKIFVIGDPHFKTNNIEETNEMSIKILQLIDSLKPHAVVCLGDVLDRHETIHVGPLLRSIDLFQKIASEYPLYILIGNHDRPSNQVFLTEEHPFTALKLWKNTKIIDKVISDTIHDKEFLFVPYVPPGRFVEAIETFVPFEDHQRRFESEPEAVLRTMAHQISKFTCIFAHQEFRGAKMGIVESVVGDVWSSENPLVVSGHIHDFDVLAPNIIYTGTPIQHAFGDNEDKRVFLFTFDNHGFKYEGYDLELPKKKIVKISCSEVSLLHKLNPEFHYKIIISGTPEELKTIKLGPFLQKLPKSKIVYKTISSISNPFTSNLSFDTKHFLELLYEEIEKTTEGVPGNGEEDRVQEQRELMDMYIELFGMNKIAENRFIIL
jgi:DNA repair exonuclease SbcCD nuclease subunit